MRAPETPAATLELMRFYPTATYRRVTTMAFDLAILVLIAVFAGFAHSVHGAVSELATIARGVETAGVSAQNSLESAAERVGQVPLVGEPIAEALRDTGEGPSAEAVALGRNGRRDIEATANALAAALFVVPTLLLLIGYLPNRVAQIQRLSAARRAMRRGRMVASGHPRLLAMRALFHLPYSTLLRYTDDPFGDFHREDYAALVAAAEDEAGLLRR